jgi:hypothetical protein
MRGWGWKNRWSNEWEERRLLNGLVLAAYESRLRGLTAYDGVAEKTAERGADGATQAGAVVTGAGSVPMNVAGIVVLGVVAAADR